MRAAATSLLAALRSADFTVDHSEAGLYLWATRGEPCRDTVAWLAERGILVAPGEFYGAAGNSARPGGADGHRRTHQPPRWSGWASSPPRPNRSTRAGGQS